MWQPAGIKGLAPIYPSASEVITTVGCGCRGISEDVGKKGKTTLLQGILRERETAWYISLFILK